MKNKIEKTVFIAAFVLGLGGFITGMLLPELALGYRLGILIPSFVLLESKVIYSFFESLFCDRTVGEELLVIVASGITIGLGDYFESLSLVVMYLIGEFILHLIKRNTETADEHNHGCGCACCHPRTKRQQGVMAFIKYYIVAVLAGIVIVLILSAFMPIVQEDSILKTLAILLLIACPCTLFISSPLCKYYAFKALKHNGIAMHDLNAIDLIAKKKTFESAQCTLDGYEEKQLVYEIAQSYKRKVIQNICIIIAAKVLFMILSLWLSTTLFAVGADIAIALLVFINSIFLGLKYRKKAA